MKVTITSNINLVEMFDGVTKQMKSELQTWGAQTVLDIRNNANFPFDTGRLNRSINGQYSETETGAKYVIEANTPYAAYVEFGTILRLFRMLITSIPEQPARASLCLPNLTCHLF